MILSAGSLAISRGRSLAQGGRQCKPRNPLHTRTPNRPRKQRGRGLAAPPPMTGWRDDDGARHPDPSPEGLPLPAGAVRLADRPPGPRPPGPPGAGCALSKGLTMELRQGTDWAVDDLSVREDEAVLAAAEGGDRILRLL